MLAGRQTPDDTAPALRPVPEEMVRAMPVQDLRHWDRARSRVAHHPAAGELASAGDF